MSKVDHWEALFNRNYMRWFHLNGQPALVEIVSVQPDVEMTLPGGAKTNKPVLTFKPIKGAIDEVKPLVLNTTNGNSIATIAGKKPSQWPGKQIVLYPDMTDMYDKQLKKMVKRECIRVRAPKAQAQK